LVEASWVKYLLDLNGDGFADLLSSRPPEVLINSQRGSFGAPSLLPPLMDWCIPGGDFNGDGIQDLICSSDRGVPAVELGLGNATFGSPQPISTGFASSLVVAPGYLHGQAKPLDLVSINNGPDLSSISVLSGLGNGTFEAPMIYSVGRGELRGDDLEVLDFDGDGFDDVVIRDDTDPGGSFQIFHSDGDGRLGSPQTVIPDPAGLQVGLSSLDLDGDGRIYLVGQAVHEDDPANRVSTNIFWPLSDGGLSAPLRPVGQGILEAVVDLNGDGALDMIITPYGQGKHVSSQIYLNSCGSP
jgi:hypothetical protein